MLFTLEMAKGVYLAYAGMLDKSSEEQDKALKDFYISQYNLRSSFSSAMHIYNKLNIIGGSIKDNLENIANLIEDNLDMLAISEYLRRNAFMRTEGYIKASKERVKQYIIENDNNSHVNHLSKEHPCLVEWAELNYASLFINELYKSHNMIHKANKDFTKYDYDIVKSIQKSFSMPI
ncbi:MAG: hypothetical protein PHT03_08560 [Bacilli bacterium]|nr:hypothetical protein [Bacilli bacterium]